MARTLLIALGAAITIALPAGAPAATVNVQITRAGFIPQSVEVKAGDTVTWTNADTQNRQVVSRDAPFASPVLKPGEQFSFTFTKEGRFQYEDPLLRPRQRGTVVVAAAPPGVTIAAGRPTAVYGTSVTLSGKISTGAANERVTVLAQACGAASFTPVGDATTATGGTWALAVKPLSTTSYRVQWRAATSPSVAVKLAPRLRLARVAPKRFTLRVSAAASFAGKAAVVQRYNATLRRWVRVRTVTLRPLGGVAPTVVSGVGFRASVRARLRVRVLLGQAQVGACYLPGRSNTVRA